MDTTATPTTTPTTPLPDEQDPVLVSPRHGSGSIGPFFAVMSVIIILSALSCIVGRFCAWRAQGPDAWYDCLGWTRRRCCSGRCTLGCHDVEREAAVDLDPKVRESKQLSLPSPQP